MISEEAIMNQCEEELIKSNTWKSFVNETSFAFYIVKNDAAFTIVYGNDAFYEILKTTKEEIQYRFGNSLTALLDTKEFQKVKQATNHHYEFVHEIEIKDQTMDLLTQVQCCDRQEFLLCLSMDISHYEINRKQLNLIQHILETLLPQSSREVFLYDQESKEVSCLFHRRFLKGIDKQLSYEALLTHLNTQAGCSNQLQSELTQIIQATLKKKETITKELSLTKQEWVKLTTVYYESLHQAKPTVLVMLQDITAEKSIYLNYLEETQFYHMLLSEKVAYGHINVSKNTFYAMGGVWDLYNEFVDQLTYTQLYIRFINKVVHPEDRKAYLELMNCDNLLQSYRNGTTRLKYEFRRIIEQNKMMWMEIEILLFQEPMNHDMMGLMFLNNIDERKKSNFQLQYQSEIDQLTNVFNKVSTENQINKILQENTTAAHAFMILDLDNFKDINDHFGHKIGDELLIQFSSSLRAVFYENCIIGRFGGDEFLVFMKNIQGEEDVKRQLNTLYHTLNQRTTIAFSAGVTIVNGKTSYDQMFAQADQALYDVKYTHKGSYGFYHIEQVTYELQNNIDAQRKQAITNVEANMNPVSEFDQYLGEFGEMAYLVNPDHYGLILGNQAFYDRVGLTREQCHGMKCYEVMHHRDTPCPFCGKANWSSDKYYIWKDINQSLEQEFLIKNKLITWNDQETLLALAIDISNNKSIVDSMESGASESHILLSSIQHMQEHMDIQGAMSCILEAVCAYFKADYAGIWQRDHTSGEYALPYEWETQSKKTMQLTAQEKEIYNAWLKAQRWDQPINIESPQEMLSQSFELYQIMQRYHVQNQRWIRLQERGIEYGCLVIINLSANFRNVSFLSSLSVFITNEIKKQHMIETIVHANHFDQLTDVYNRNSFEYRVRNYSPEQVSSIGVVVANIDHLKEINKVNGNTTGDQYIKRVAHILRNCFQSSDVYRLNGDEFLVILTNVNKRMLDDGLKTVKMKLKQEEFDVSFGYAWDDIEKDLDELIASATYIMQVNKKHHYEALQESSDLRQRKLLRDLMEGIKQKEYIIYLQPKVNMQTQTIFGAEALIRQKHKEFGLLPPSEFIPALESNSLIRYIDLYVFEEVCKLLHEWKQNSFKISLNFSRITLMEENIIDNIKQIIDRYEFPRALLEIEMTESATGDHPAVLHEIAHEISRLGLRISLDDFGIRYSNLSMLSEVYFDTIKLDKSLIKSLVTNKRNRFIVKNIIHMCKELEIESIAEGVETKLQEDILMELGCMLGQGYLYGKPVSVEEFLTNYHRQD